MCSLTLKRLALTTAEAEQRAKDAECVETLPKKGRHNNNNNNDNL